MNNDALNRARTAMAELNRETLKPWLRLAVRRIAILALAYCCVTLVVWTAFWLSQGLDTSNFVQASFSILALTSIVAALVAALCMGLAAHAFKVVSR